MSEIRNRAKFDFIRYANCWEDPALLLKALHPLEGQVVLSVASAGDNSFSLLTGNPEKVVAVDFNPAQLACCDLRKAAFLTLNYKEVLEFAGILPSKNRMEVFQNLKSGMLPESVSFWDAHPDWIMNGYIHCGKFEKYLKFFGTRIIPFIHSRKTITDLLAEKSIQQQKEFYSKRWNSALWRGLFRLFFSKLVMGKMGRDAEFFKYSEQSPSDMILERTRHAFTEISTHNNPYLTYILTGNYNSALPHYLREENFNIIRGNLHKLEFFHGGVQDAIEKYPGAFTRFNLSDIFEYMSQDEFENLSGQLHQFSGPGAKVACWNLLAYRNLDRFTPNWKTDSVLSEQLHRIDQAWFYSHFFISEKQNG
ncbi:MAG: BtaA family protein [Bacteroidetes bacterium]|nr:BtaA family protein [Bacteroidota bacterium]